MIGEKRVLAQAIHRERGNSRMTTLPYRLEETLPSLIQTGGMMAPQDASSGDEATAGMPDADEAMGEAHDPFAPDQDDENETTLAASRM